MGNLRACHCCGLIHRVPPLNHSQFATCTRCQATIQRKSDGLAASRTAAAALGAFFLFWPAMLLPILELDRLGHHKESSLLFGTIELLTEGDWFVGIIVLVFSIIFPFVKIVMLLELSLFGLMQRRYKTLAYRFMEYAGKWSMMDVLLLAFLVMLVKLGDVVEFRIGPAVLAFVLCVAMSMIASLSFDPHSIWEEQR